MLKGSLKMLTDHPKEVYRVPGHRTMAALPADRTWRHCVGCVLGLR